MKQQRSTIEPQPFIIGKKRYTLEQNLFDMDDQPPAMEEIASKLTNLALEPGTAGPYPPTIDPYATIPLRILAKKRVKVIPSRIPSAGRGMMACSKIQAHELILETNDPMFAVVEDGKYMTQHCCDNCFATIEEDTKVQTIQTHRPLKFAPCGGCYVVYYCGKVCQTQAWKKHHKLECKNLKQLRQLTVQRDASGEEIQSEDMPAVYRAMYRLMMRVLCLSAPIAVRLSYYAEIAGIYSPDRQDLTVDEVAHIRAAATLLNEITGIFGKVQRMVELWHMVSANHFTMSVPLFRPWGQGYKFDSEPSIKATRWLDPFFSLMNHSCDPNTAMFFEGRNIRLVATRDIDAREELTIAYIPYSHYKIRKLELEKRWGFECRCSVCERCRQSMHGPAAYFNRILWANPVDRQAMLFISRSYGDQVIDDEVTQITMWHLRLHYKNMFLRHCKSGDRKNALKCAIEVFSLGNSVWPKMPEDELQDAIYHLLHQLEDQEIEIGSEILNNIHMQLRMVKSDHLALRYGVYSIFAMYERSQFARSIVAWEEKYCKNWHPASRHSGVMKVFVKELNVLMDWAEIPPVLNKQVKLMTHSPLIGFVASQPRSYQYTQELEE